MTRPKLMVVTSEQPEQPKAVKKYRFEVGLLRLVVYVFGLTAAMCWMFVLGVLVGRGVPLVNSDDSSLHAGFLRLMGLDKQAGQPTEHAAETWGDPKRMLETLNYYEELTQKGVAQQAPAPMVAAAAPPAPVPAAAPPLEGVVEKPKSAKKPAAATTTLPQPPERPAAPEPDRTLKSRPAGPPAAYELFTLLVASLRDPDNAQRLMSQLRAKGYAPRIEAIDLNGGGRWNRVLLGSFQNRDAALRFATDLNRKEHMECLVIREPN